MATKNPRMQVVVTQRVLAVYTHAASVMGVSASKLAAQVLYEASESISEVAGLIEQSKSDQTTAGLKAAEALKGMLVDARQSAADVQLDLEDVIAAHKRSSKVKAVRPARPKAKAKPKA